MSLQATFEPKKPTFRGSSSSSDLNTMTDQLLYDLNSIFTSLSQQEVDFYRLSSVLHNESTALDSRIRALRESLDAHRGEMGKRAFFEDFSFSTRMVYPSSLLLSQRCRANTEFGLVSLPVNQSVSRVYTIKISTGEVFQSPQLYVEVSPVNEDGNLAVETTSPLRAFNGNNQSYWERVVDFDINSSKTEVTCKLNVTLPPTSNPDVNSICLYPYPQGQIDITQLNYNTLTTQDNAVSSFVTASNAKNSFYSFDAIQPISFELGLKQTNPVEQGGYLSFIYGLQEMGISNISYQSTGKFGIKFSLPDYVTGSLNKLTSFVSDPTYNNSTIKFKLYTNQADFDADVPSWESGEPALTEGSPLDISSALTRDIWILGELTQEDGKTNSPLINSLSLNYSII